MNPAGCVYARLTGPRLMKARSAAKAKAARAIPEDLAFRRLRFLATRLWPRESRHSLQASVG